MIQPNANVTDFLLEGKEPGRTAIRMIGRDYSYGELTNAAIDVASYLLNIRRQPQDRVLLIADNSLFWIAAYLGIMRAGLICVPLPASVSVEELRHVTQVTEAGVVFAQATFAAQHADELRGLQLVTERQMPASGRTTKYISLDDLRSRVERHNVPLAPVHPDDLAALMFTSGSTGAPRGVMISHRNIVANTESIIAYLDLTKEDRMMTVLPFHYCFGTSLLHTHLRAGGSLVLDSRFMYPEVVLQRMFQTECTGFAGVPSHFQILLRNSSIRRKPLPHLRHVQQAGGHLAPTFVRELREAWPHVRLFIMYGQTEATARLSYLPPDLVDSKPGSIGKAIPGVKLRVVDESGADARPGEIGEIVAEGENIASGYWRAPEESQATFRDGKLFTGDIATVDSEGFIYVVDRARDFVKCGGKRVSCNRLQDQLVCFEDLVEAAVIGVPDDVLGEAVKAFVVPRASARNGLEARLQAFCRARMAPEAVPKQVVVLGSLPKNSGGKVLKSQLRALGTAPQ